jgi:hypothetical protein
MTSGPPVGEGGPNPIQRGRELVAALSRFCKSVEEMTMLESVEDYRRVGDGLDRPKPVLTDAKVHLLSLTELVQQTSVVLDELFAEIEASRITRF